MHSERFEPRPEFPPAVNERILAAKSVVNERIDALSANPTYASSMDKAAAHLARALSAKKASAAVHWFHLAASQWSEPLHSVAACKKGCSHCCHIPVAIGHAEAVYIAEKTGHKFNEKADATFDPEQPQLVGYSSPCPFLVDNTCSIHAIRPQVCRTHVNMDEDDLLCRLVPGARIPVPYANANAFIEPALRISKFRLADIRQWFPAVGRLTTSVRNI